MTQSASFHVDPCLTAILGENGHWIASFARYHRQPIISRANDFDRVPALSRGMAKFAAGQKNTPFDAKTG